RRLEPEHGPHQRARQWRPDRLAEPDAGEAEQRPDPEEPAAQPADERAAGQPDPAILLAQRLAVAAAEHLLVPDPGIRDPPERPQGLRRLMAGRLKSTRLGPLQCVPALRAAEREPLHSVESCRISERECSWPGRE